MYESKRRALGYDPPLVRELLFDPVDHAEGADPVEAVPRVVDALA